MSHNYWAPEHLEPVLCNEKPLQWKARMLQLESNPCSPQLEKACVQQRRPSAAKINFK